MKPSLVRITIASTFSSLALPLIAKADSTLPGVNSGQRIQQIDDRPTTLDSIVAALEKNILHNVYLLLGAIAVILLVVAGMQYIFSGGDPAKTKQARATIVQVVLGIILLSASYLVIELILQTATYFAGKA